MNALFRLLLFLLPLVWLTGCDHRLMDPNPLGDFRLKTVSYNARFITNITYATATYTLHYDAAGRLDYYVATRIPASFPDTIGVFRNAQGQINQIGRVSRGVLISTSPYNTYSYTAQNQLSRIVNGTIVTIRPSGIQLFVNYTNDFLYGNESLIPQSRTIRDKQEQYTFVSENATRINGVVYTYDDKPNPFRGLVGFSVSPDFRDLSLPASGSEPYDNSAYFTDTQAKLFNKNNITNNATLTYNADGLVSRIVYTNGNVEEFTYERKP